MSSVANKFSQGLYANSIKKESTNSRINQAYVLELIKQYQSARGVPFDASSKKSVEDFHNWLISQKINGDTYLYLMNKSNIITDLGDVAEVGKGYEDSIVLSHDQTSIITPYPESILCPPYGELYDAKFTVYDGKPVLLDKYTFTEKEPADGISTYMTQNPYSYDELDKWAELHNNITIDGIIVGVYGGNTDKDKEAKLEKLMQFKNRLGYWYIDNYTNVGGHYYYFIATKRPEKIRYLAKKGIRAYAPSK